MECVDGVCSNKKCSDDSLCPDGYSCINGLCGIPDSQNRLWIIIVLVLIVIVLSVAIYFGYHKIKPSTS
jgi:hypothetical protein